MHSQSIPTHATLLDAIEQPFATQRYSLATSYLQRSVDKNKRLNVGVAETIFQQRGKTLKDWIC